MKKFGIATSIGLGIIIVLVIFFKIGGAIKSALNPPKIDPANQAYGKLQLLEFPQATISKNFTYEIETETGKLPENTIDRMIVYPIIQNPPNLNNLKNVKQKVKKLGFINDSGLDLEEIPRGNAIYEWDEPTGIQRQILFDTVSLNFSMTSKFLESNSTLRADSSPTPQSALTAVQDYLSKIDSFPSDIDLIKTQQPKTNESYATQPELFDILNGNLVPATSLSQTKVIRVDLYQKNITYKITAGKDNDLTRFEETDQDLPILYPHPPHSTMNFIVASGPNGLDVVTAIYNHQSINLTPVEDIKLMPTYPIKTTLEAFTDLKAGQGYIACCIESPEQILISKVYLGYFLGDAPQKYLWPIFIFEGQRGFFAYVSAIRPDALE